MPTTICAHSPAKLNLFLHINGKRDDGYHELQTYFLLIDACDTLEFSAHNDVVLNILNTVPPNLGDPLTKPKHDDAFVHNNLIVKAAHLLKQHANYPLGARIYLKKNLPLGGGLGGGSSNAATTLLALNRLWSLDLCINQLATLGAQLGADVPVFVRGHSAWADGIGDKLQAHYFAALNDCTAIVLTPDIHVSTAKLFADTNLPRNTPKYSLCNYHIDHPSFVNDFEALAVANYPKVRQALQYLRSINQDALTLSARLTGTGASVFALVPTRSQAQALLARAPCSGFLAKPLAHSPRLTETHTKS